MSNPYSPRRGVENAVLQLQERLILNHSAAEKLMSLRNPDESNLRELSAKIDSAYKNLTEIIEQAPTHETSTFWRERLKTKLSLTLT